MSTWINNTNVKKAQVHPLVLQRKKLGIKQHVLADLTGLGITTIKRAEYGDKISPYTISAICNFFSERLKRQFQPEELFLASQWQEAEIDILNSPITTEKNTSVGLQKHLANHDQPLAPIESNNFFSFGSLTTKLIILDGNGTETYDPQNISTFYDPRPITFLEDIQRIKSQIEEEQTQARSNEKLLPWNGHIYHLANYQLSREPIHEHMKLNLWFRPTDYFTVLAKNRYLKNTNSQDKYLTDDLNISSFDIPIPFGVGLSIITRDGYIIFAQREGNLEVRPGYFMTSVEEGLSRPVDRGTISDAPDLYRCACRGLSEELGLVEKRDFSISDIQFLGLGIDTELFMCGLRGLLKLQLDARTIIKNWETGVRDKMENRRLFAIPFTLESVCDFVLNHGLWGGGALMGIYHTLVHEFGKEQTNTAIITCCTTMSNESDTSNNPRLNEEILARKPMPGEYPDISLLRRQFLQLPALGLFSLVPTADYSNIMLRFNSAFSRQQLSIDDHLLQHFEYRSRHFWQSRHASLLSLVDLWHAVTQHLHKMLTYLDNPLLPQKRAHLCAILSKTAQLAGVLAYDAGQLHVARSWYALAIQAAQESDEQGLIAIASGWMTFTWLSDQDYNQGLLSVQRAAEIARHTSDGFLIAWLQAIEAEIQIHRQEPAACLAALKQAEGLSDASIKDEHFYLFDFDPTQLQGYQGICLQQLYQKDNPTTHPYLRDAQQVLEQAVASSIPIRRRATYLHDLAGVFARKGEIEAACALIAQSLPLLIELGEGEKTTQLRLVGARNQLSLAADSTAVRTLDEQIACLNENVVKNL